MSKPAPKTPSRIYAVNRPSTGGTVLVRAVTPAQALRHVAGREFVVEVASQDAIIDAMQRGAKVMDATVEPVEPSSAPSPTPAAAS